MKKIILVGGIDTGIGKTVSTGIIAKSLLARGRDVITVKLVQTGNVGHSEDIDLHREICGVRYPEDERGLTAPQIFAFPSSPELSARLEGKTVDVGKITAAVNECSARHEVTLVEAAGGLLVPLTRELLTLDLAAREGWSVALVTCGRLGSLSHTLLSLEAIKSRGMKLAGIVYNYHPDADPLIDEDTPARTLEWLERNGLPAPLVRIPRVAPGGPYPTIADAESLVD